MTKYFSSAEDRGRRSKFLFRRRSLPISMSFLRMVDVISKNSPTDHRLLIGIDRSEKRHRPLNGNDRSEQWHRSF